MDAIHSYMTEEMGFSKELEIASHSEHLNPIYIKTKYS